ncbi:MAG: hypothetical protein K0Q71_5103 [Thermomicrobiales bacterium]|nr:hypothetical protein [Thermomicrobiales bacterium]
MRDHAAVDADDPRQVRRDGIQLVGGEHHGHSLAVQLGEQVQDVVAGLDVDTGGGLVENEEVRLANQRARQEHPLLLSAGEVTNLPPAQAGQSQPLQDDRGSTAILPAGPGQWTHAAYAPHHHDVLDRDREGPVDRFDLGYVADSLGRTTRRDRDAIDENPARDPRQAAEDRLEQRRLPGAAGTDQSHELPAWDAHADVVDDVDRVVTTANTA